MIVQNDNYLIHHGMLGQRWGVKHGPPYPLDKKSQEILRKEWRKEKRIDDREIERRKKDVIATGDVKAAAANKFEFSEEEINQVIQRFNKQNELMSKVPEEKIQTGIDKFNEWSAKAQKVGDAAKKAGEAYNVAAAFSNAFFNTELPKVDFGNMKSGKWQREQNKPKEEKKDLIKEKQDKATLKQIEEKARQNAADADAAEAKARQEWIKVESSEKKDTKPQSQNDAFKSTIDNYLKEARTNSDKDNSSYANAIEFVADKYGIKDAYNLASNSDYIRINGEWVKK